MHFGKQVRKERLAHGLALTEFAQRIGFDPGHLSRIENGKRPPTLALATACDTAFPERRGWFTEYYEELSTWSEVPAGFRSWAELEDKAVRLGDWSPSVVTGLLQTEDYAGALLRTYPGASAETIASRLRSRLERQRRVLMKDDPPAVCFLVDEMALYRLVGSAEMMAAQMRQLSAMASMPKVTIQVVPATAHPGTASGMVVADEVAAYAEHLNGGFVYTGESASSLVTLFDSLRSESYRASESLALIDGTCETWMAGVSPLTAGPTAGSA